MKIEKLSASLINVELEYISFTFTHCECRLSYFVSTKAYNQNTAERDSRGKTIFVKKKGQPGATKLMP